MGEVIQFRKPTAQDKNKGKTLCKSGFHKWEVSTKKQFEVKQGKLITLYICARCGHTKTEVK